MRKRYWIAFATLVLLLFLVDRTIKVHTEKFLASSTENEIQRKGLIELEGPTSPIGALVEKVSDHDSRTSTKTEQELFEDEMARVNECWKKIESQVPSSTDFLQANREQLGRVVGEWFYRHDPKLAPNGDTSPKQEKFFLGLAKAGLLDGYEMERNDKEALRLLGQVAKEDPKNSAPLLFASLIRQRHGDEEGAKKLLEAARRTQYFNSYVTEYIQNVYRSIETPGDFVSALGAWGESPVPNYLALKNVIDKDEKFGNQLMEPARKAEDNPLELNWLLLEYATGQSALGRYNKANGKPAPDLPRWPELMKKSVQLHPWAHGSDDILKSCDISTIERHVGKLKEYLASHPAAAL